MRTVLLSRLLASSSLALICSTACALGAGQPAPENNPTPAPKAPAPTTTSIGGVGASLQVRPGVVTDLQTFTPESKSNTAQVVGGVVGGLAGVLLTKDSDWGTRALAGTAGAALGTQAAKVLVKPDQRLRITLRLDNGQVAVVEQDMEEQFQISQRVNLVGDNLNAKVRAISP